MTTWELVLASIVSLALALFGPRLSSRPGTPRWVSVLMLLVALVLVVAVTWHLAGNSSFNGGG